MAGSGVIPNVRRLQDGAQRRGYSGYISSPPLVAKTNAECARSANEVTIGTHDFEFSDGVTDFDRANLRAGERDHFSEFTRSDEFHRCCAED